MKDILQDALRFTAGTGFFECVKITSDDNETVIQASDGLPTIVLNGKTKKPVEELDGIFGFGSLSYLTGLMKIDQFKSKDAKIEVVSRDRNGEKTPEMLKFSTPEGNEVSYRLMHQSTIPAIPTFKGTDWDVVIEPSKEKIDELSQMAGLYSDMEEHVIFKTVGNDLVYYIGEENAASHKSKMTFQKNVNGKLETALKWPMQQLLSALRLSQAGKSSMKLSTKGVICLSIDSGLAEYNIYIIANQK